MGSRDQFHARPHDKVKLGEFLDGEVDSNPDPISLTL